MQWWKLIAAGAAIAVAYGAIATAWRQGARSDIPTSTVATGVYSSHAAVDDFGRADDDTLGSSITGQSWRTISGHFAIVDNRAVATNPDRRGAPALAIIDSGASDATVEAEVTDQGFVCGVVLRYLDPDNYLALDRVPEFGVWNVDKIVGGSAVRIGVLADTGAVPVRIRLVASGTHLTASVGNATINLEDQSPGIGTGSGLFAKVPTAGRCRWSTFSAWPAP